MLGSGTQAQNTLDAMQSISTISAQNPLIRIFNANSVKFIHLYEVTKMTEEMIDDQNDQASFAVFSGDMDKVMGAFIIAIGAATFDMDVTLFFAFWGLKAIQKGNLTGKSFFERMLGFMNRGGIERIGPSRLNFGGLGRWLFKKMMKDNDAYSMSELLKQAQELGIHLIACQMSMDVMGITTDDLIDGIEIGGVGDYVDAASESKFSLFI